MYRTRHALKRNGISIHKGNPLFPLLDNDGEPFDIEVWRWWQRELQRLGDYTEFGTADGIFRGQATGIG